MVQKQYEKEVELDSLTDLAEKIGQFLSRKRLAATPKARAMGIEHTVIFDPERMDEANLFVSALSVRYEMTRAVP
ncbi:unnamed protein product [marine sediment metagenome]|uniref:Uncharacterized protein n=1 Tax=marine sediment metagenome TaxID=412755 RepID=X1IKJ4_9ZZZZ